MVAVLYLLIEKEVSVLYVVTEDLKKLFKIKYLDQVTDPALIAQEMSLPETELLQLSGALDQHLISVLLPLTPERQNPLSFEGLQRICPECLLPTLISDIENDEKVCNSCGAVLPESGTPDENLPFGEAFKPTSDLASDRSLGSCLTATFTPKAQYEFQKKSGSTSMSLRAFKKLHPDLAQKLTQGEPAYNGDFAYLLEKPGDIVYWASSKDIATYTLNKNLLSHGELKEVFHMNDLPLRFYRFRILSSTENPELDQLLKEAFGLSIRYGLGGSKVFNNNLGRNLRRAYLLVRELRLKVPKHSIPGTAFYYTVAVANDFSGQTLNITLNAAADKLDKDSFLVAVLMHFNELLSDVRRLAEQEPKAVLRMTANH